MWVFVAKKHEWRILKEGSSAIILWQLYKKAKEQHPENAFAFEHPGRESTRPICNRCSLPLPDLWELEYPRKVADTFGFCHCGGSYVNTVCTSGTQPLDLNWYDK